MSTALKIIILSALALVVFCIGSILMVISDEGGCTLRIVEIEQVHNALRVYKESCGMFPPCLSSIDPVARRGRFMHHLSVLYPYSTHGRGEEAYEALRKKLQSPGGLGIGSQPYTFRKQDGTIALLDLDSLDPAESLVFWLAGFPAPLDEQGSSVAPTKTYGFNRDRDNPMRRDSAAAESVDPMRFRTDPRMEFRQELLVDSDDDGWWEYLPRRSRDGKPCTTPFVYFDARSYQDSLNNGLLGAVRYPDGAGLPTEWGFATPILKTLDPEQRQKSVWMNPQSFQLIDAGDDDAYGPTLTPNLRRVIELAPKRVWTVVDGLTLEQTSLSKKEADNETNLGAATIGEITP